MHNLKSIYTDFILFPSLILITVSFPLPLAYNSIFTILLFLVFLAGIKTVKTNISSYIKNNRNILLLIIFFCLLLSSLYSDDKKQAIKGILAALPMLSLPLSLSGIMNLSSRQTYILKKIFVFTCFAASLVYLVLAMARSGLFDGTHLPQVYTKDSLSYYVHYLTYYRLSTSVHPIFFSLYIAFAIFIIIFGIEKITLGSKILYGLLLVYLFVYLLLLTSIIINFSLYSFLIGYTFFMFSFKKWHHYIFFFGLMLAGTAITAYLFILKYVGLDGDGTYRFDLRSINNKFFLCLLATVMAGVFAIIIKLFIRSKIILVVISTCLLASFVTMIYLKGMAIDRNNSDWKINSITVRFDYGAEAIRLIKKNPMLGVGIGDKKIKLLSKQAKLTDDMLPEYMFNPHNQFLDFWISAGIIPVICFLLFLINEISKAIRYKHIVYLGLVYCFCLFCFTDIAMMVQRGQIFFLFFICLFEIESRKKVTPTSLS